MNLNAQDVGDVEEFARENREMLLRVLRHSSDTTARAYAWAILDRGLSEPELDKVMDDLEQFREGVA